MSSFLRYPVADNSRPVVRQEDDNNQVPAQRAFPDQQVQALARSYTQVSERRPTQVTSDNPFDAVQDENSELNPNSEKFNARQWVKAMIGMQASDGSTLGRTAGLSWTGLHAYGAGAGLDYQDTVSNKFLQAGGKIQHMFGGGKGERVEILQPMDGLLRAGEMLVVLGPPGSGCSTLLKTISGETHGFHLEGDRNYQGISPKQFHHDFRGEAVYTAEVDVHFPELSVGDTLTFAARARAPRHPVGGVSQEIYADHLRDVMMAVFGISHTINTKVGNDFVRGVSGGERKRVTICEAALARAPLQCWDNSTRGLDSANAVEFCKTLRLSSDLAKTASVVAIYQAPQSAYDYFDKVSLLFKGRQIYFGKTTTAKKFFTDMGFFCPERQTTADFLTSLTSDLERRVQEGFEGKVPTTPEAFEQRWKSSKEYSQLKADIAAYNKEFPIGAEALEMFQESRKAEQAKNQRAKSPYTISYGQQIGLCTWRGWKRLIQNPELTLTQLFGNFATALIIGSVYYNLPQTSGSFFQRGALLFFAILLAAFASALEILTLYAQRPIVEKHTRYAFYHPSAEAFASALCDLPYKLLNSITFGLTLYFMTNLRREPGRFFFFWLITFTMTMVMSSIFRTIGSASRSLAEALTPAALLILGLVIYTGFTIPTRSMLGWSRWINYIDPVSFAFEALMVNEFSGQNFACSSFVPSYATAGGNNRACSAVGSVIGEDFVSGTAYINTSYEYYTSNKWRNFGILIAFAVFFFVTYLAATELIQGKKSKGEVLVFQRAYLKKMLRQKDDPELGAKKTTEKQQQQDVSMIPKQTAIFQWENVNYDIKIKGETRRILDHVDGWVKPGTLTALMGVSGAGKTTLLDVLATRVTMGVVTGKMLVDGKQRDASFQRKTGYVQQQDLHLSTSTVREALTFSAELRQPAHIPKEEKLAYVEEVITLLDMDTYADAIVGVPGEGLNVEQRKRLTIGVELAAKPQLLLFLDEPTSGLDSQTSWAICDLLTKLADHGQAVLCTIHQPSAMLFQRFNRLLFLAKGGRTIYFGSVGDGSKVLTSYFERNGAKPCPEEANPAEWMLEVIGAAPGTHSDIDWHKTWRSSPEYQEVKKELRSLEERGNSIQSKSSENKAERKEDAAAFKEFAASLPTQFMLVTKRVFQQYWRTPSYIYAKITLVTLSTLFIGFSFFRADRTQQGLQNQLFSAFMVLTLFGNLAQQLLPQLQRQRELYEARERPSKTYSWKVFLLASFVVEVPYTLVAGLLAFLCYWYPVALYRNAEFTDSVSERSALFFLILEMFMLFTSSFTIACFAGISSIETAGNIENLIFSLSLIFCGVLAAPQTLGWWIWMYRVSPFSYIVEGLLTAGIANAPGSCSDIEFVRFEAPNGQTCGQYMQEYISAAGGFLQDPDSTGDCSFCAIDNTNSFLTNFGMSYSNRWRDFGILWVYVIVNLVLAAAIYYFARVPKSNSVKETVVAEDSTGDSSSVETAVEGRPRKTKSENAV